MQNISCRNPIIVTQKNRLHDKEKKSAYVVRLVQGGG